MQHLNICLIETLSSCTSRVFYVFRRLTELLNSINQCSTFLWEFTLMQDPICYTVFSHMWRRNTG